MEKQWVVIRIGQWEGSSGQTESNLAEYCNLVLKAPSHQLIWWVTNAAIQTKPLTLIFQIRLRLTQQRPGLYIYFQGGFQLFRWDSKEGFIYCNMCYWELMSYLETLRDPIALSVGHAKAEFDAEIIEWWSLIDDLMRKCLRWLNHHSKAPSVAIYGNHAA